jgi:undecaprenyl pyrophosphate phosphatase UppP
MKVIEFIKKYPKDSAMLLTVVVALFIAVMGVHFADTAKSPFWWNFWLVANVVCIVACVAAWIYAWKTQPKK